VAAGGDIQTLAPPPRRAPWSIAGGPDPDFQASARETARARLTDPELITRFRRRFPTHRGADYDEMVRALGYVWDCPIEGTANVTGYRCATCKRTLAEAGG
jgi:hypothetical protein